jgi:RNA polymerase sigma factor (sigma-70 family)
LTESELIQGCIDKRRDYQKLLFNRYSGKMMSVCLRYANDEHQAQDILQEGFIKVFKYIGQYRFEGSFEGWMRRVFVNVAARSLTKRKMQFSDIDITDSKDQAVDPSVLSKISENEIHMMIRSMPDGYRTVFNLSVIEGYTHEEIGSMLGIQASTSRGQLLKARKYLQNLVLKKFNTIKI